MVLAHRTIREPQYNYFTYTNSFKYIGILPKFVKAYNFTIHSTTGMALSHVTDSDILAKWKKVEAKGRRSIRLAKVRFSVVQLVRISKGMMKFSKGAEQNFSIEIFRITKVIQKRQRPVNEMKDLNKTLIYGQFYGEELTPVRISKQTTYKIDKILVKRVKRGIQEYLVRLRDYSHDFNSWLPAFKINHI